MGALNDNSKDNNTYEESNEIMTNILVVNCIDPSIQNI